MNLHRRARTRPISGSATIGNRRDDGKNRLDNGIGGGKISYMSSKRTGRAKGALTMTETLRQALTECDSMRAVERATGVKRQSLMKFARGEQSLRLDMADKLAVYFGMALVHNKKRRQR